MTMKRSLRLTAAAMLLFCFLQSNAEQQPRTVHITVIHNGHEVPAPTEIVIVRGGHTLRVPIRKGKFEVPAEISAAQYVIVRMDVEHSHIRLTKIAGTDFSGRWTLRLAEHADDEYYEWPGPKEADIAASCMLELDNGHEDPGRIRFEQNCRKPKQ